MDKPKWNRNNILHWILERHSQGESVRAKDALAYNSNMYHVAVRSFGSWAGALATAGINLPPRKGARTWSPKQVLSAIRRAGVKPESLCFSNMCKHRRGLLEAAKKHFGSRRKALIAAGIDPESARLTRRWDRESVIEVILDRAVKNEPLAVTKVSPRSLGGWGIRLFGSWADALRAAGLDPDRYVGVRSTTILKDSSVKVNHSQRWSRDRIASELRRRVHEGKPINMARLKIKNRSLHSAIRRYFENWDAALVHAGLNPQEFRKCRSRHIRTAPLTR